MEPIQRHSMVIIADLRSFVDKKLRIPKPVSEMQSYIDLDKLIEELEKALILEALEASLTSLREHFELRRREAK